MTEEICIFETFVNVCEVTQIKTPEDSHILILQHVFMKSCKTWLGKKKFLHSGPNAKLDLDGLMEPSDDTFPFCINQRIKYPKLLLDGKNRIRI